MNQLDEKRVHKQLSILVVDRESGELKSPTLQVGQRIFQTAQLDDSRYFAYEYRPTGTVFAGETANGEINVDDSMSEAIKAAYLYNPNGFLTWLENENILQDDVFLSGGGFATNRIEYSTLDEAISAIITAVDRNELLPQYVISD